MPKNNIWSGQSKYGTYEGKRGNPQEWEFSFGFSFNQSTTVKSILGMSAYSTLNVNPTAAMDEITKSYRKLALIHHPDKGGNVEKFKEITNAYSTIKKMRSIPIVNPIKPTNVKTTDPTTTDLIDEFIPQLLTEIDESEIESFFTNNDFCCQEKKDGRHITLQIKNGKFFNRNKKGQKSTFAIEFESELKNIGYDILIDGEQIEDKFFVWDLLEFDNKDYRNLSYFERYTVLSKLNFKTIQIVEIITGEKNKREFFEKLKSKEGIVFKRLSAKFSSGKGQDQFKFKFYHECSVIVVPGRIGKASIGMELIKHDGSREFVGYCSCNKNPPIGSIAEIKYLYAYRNGCLIQPSFKELRDDVDVNECILSQLKYKSS